MTRIFATAMVAVGLSFLAPRLADAEVREVKLVLQNGSNYLPLMVMQAQNLVEKHLAAKGLAGTTVTWARLAGPSAIISLDLRERVVASVAAGRSCRSVATIFRVSVASVVKWSQVSGPRAVRQPSRWAASGPLCLLANEIGCWRVWPASRI